MNLWHLKFVSRTISKQTYIKAFPSRIYLFIIIPHCRYSLITDTNHEIDPKIPVDLLWSREVYSKHLRLHYTTRQSGVGTNANAYCRCIVFPRSIFLMYFINYSINIDWRISACNRNIVLLRYNYNEIIFSVIGLWYVI